MKESQEFWTPGDSNGDTFIEIFVAAFNYYIFKNLEFYLFVCL